MADSMMHLRALVEKAPDADIFRDMIAEIEAERGQERPIFHRKGNGRFHRALNDMSGITAIGDLMDQVNIPMLNEIYFRDLTAEQWKVNLDDQSISRGQCSPEMATPPRPLPNVTCIA